MNSSRLLASLLFLFLLATTVSAQNGRKTAPLADLAQLEGRYKVIARGDTTAAALSSICMMEYRLDRRYFRDKKCYIDIRKTRDKRLFFTLWEGDKKLASSHMKVRLKDGKAYLKRTKARIFTLVLNVIIIHRTQMALTESGDLCVSNSNLGGCALIVFFPITCAGDRPDELVFERIRGD